MNKAEMIDTLKAVLQRPILVKKYAEEYFLEYCSRILACGTNGQYSKK